MTDSSSSSDISEDLEDRISHEDPSATPHSTMGPEFNGPLDGSPSTHFEHPWLAAERESLLYDDANGKWLMFFPRKKIDSRWEEAKKLYFSGDLDRVSSVKVSTAMPSSRFPASTEHVMVFFCGAAEDETVVMEIGRNLVERFPPEARVLFYKSNAQTEVSVSQQPISGRNKAKKWEYRLNCTPRADAVIPTGLKGATDGEKLDDDEPTKVREDGPHALRKNSPIFAEDGLVIVLDTETTGFPPGAPPEDTEAWSRCRMVELAWHVYTADGVLQSREAHLIKPDFSFEIPAGAVSVHGITRAKALAEGTNLTTVLGRFSDQLSGVTAIVGHNITFDVKVLLAEMHRAGMHELLETFESIPTECTMLMGTSFMPNGKRPKLAVLFRQCFGEEPDGTMHRADADVEACARIYFYLRNLEENDESPGSGSEEEEDSQYEEDEASSGSAGSHDSGSDEEVCERDGLRPDDQTWDGNFFQTNAVLITATLAVASTAAFLYSFG